MDTPSCVALHNSMKHLLIQLSIPAALQKGPFTQLKVLLQVVGEVRTQREEAAQRLKLLEEKLQQMTAML